MAKQKRTTPSISLKPDERKKLQQRADEAGGSLGRYIRQVALCERGQNDEMAGQAERVEALRKLKRELNKLGSNLNQIARVANISGDINKKRLYDFMATVRELFVKVNQAISDSQ